METIKIIILLMCLLFVSCIRTYKVTFNYNVNGKEVMSEEVTEPNNEQIVNIPKGSGNFIIYVQAEVPKTVDANADLDASLPLPIP